MNIEIYYYSGTGNSLRVAQEMQKRIPEADLSPTRYIIATESRTNSIEIPDQIQHDRVRSLPSQIYHIQGHCQSTLTFRL